MKKTCLTLAAILAAAPLCAQWFHVPDPKLPRTKDGKVDLTAPAPRTPDGKPDLSGIWRVPMPYLTNLAGELKGGAPLQPWAEKLFKSRADGSGGLDDPAARCIPGMPKLNALPYPFKIVQTPGLMIMLFEGFTTFRQIHLDGRALPKDPEPFWMGYSVGKWDGDVLVADTIGIHEETWLDNAGHPHSPELHITEKFRRRDVGHLDIEMTIDDPKTYTRPWTVTEKATLVPDTELLEYVCIDSDYQHLVR
jgi:hypothetical protein